MENPSKFRWLIQTHTYKSDPFSEVVARFLVCTLVVVTYTYVSIKSMLGDQIIPGGRVVWYRPFLAASVDFAGFQQSQLQIAAGMTSSTESCIRHVVFADTCVEDTSRLACSGASLIFPFGFSASVFFCHTYCLASFINANDSKERFQYNEADFRGLRKKWNKDICLGVV